MMPEYPRTRTASLYQETMQFTADETPSAVAAAAPDARWRCRPPVLITDTSPNYFFIVVMLLQVILMGCLYYIYIYISIYIYTQRKWDPQKNNTQKALKNQLLCQAIQRIKIYNSTIKIYQILNYNTHQLVPPVVRMRKFRNRSISQRKLLSLLDDKNFCLTLFFNHQSLNSTL